jgi:hypothetical protein
MEKFAQGLVAFLCFTFLIPTPASATPVCAGSECIIAFDYTGSEQQWSVPAGASNIRFSVFGASGSRGGGGGSVTGVLSNLPAVLLIYVGGEGGQGRNASGGFYGGGNAGGNRGNEGSGGGASDIRTSQALSTRIVVAGGGGGGGYSGAPGAEGGGLEAAAGGSGQGGGGGGTQADGGVAGYSNGGSPGTSGTFGQGGTGGISWNAGGSGGGGGWYGGGGADDNDCCADGGGGGGGSSFANSSYTQNVAHATGVRFGHGRIEIRYTLVPVVVSFTGQQVSTVSATFTLVISEVIAGLDQGDFVVSGCSWQQLSISANTATISLGPCSHGSVSLTLNANSLGPLQNGPPRAVTATMQFDAQAPTSSWIQSTSSFSQSSAVLAFAVDGATISSIAQFDLGACQGELQDSSIRIFGFPDGPWSIAFGSNQLTDSWGNRGPAATVSYQVLFDQTAPIAVWSSVEIAGSTTFSYSTVIKFSESVSFSVSSVVFISSMYCSGGFAQLESGWRFWAEGGYGTGTWSLPAPSVLDALGNAGPVQSVAVSFQNQAPVPTQQSTSTETRPEVVTPPPQEPAGPQQTQPLTPQPIAQQPVTEPAPPTPTPAQLEPAPIEVVIEPVTTESPIIEPDTGSEEVELPPVSFDEVPPAVEVKEPSQFITEPKRPAAETIQSRPVRNEVASESEEVVDPPVERESAELTAADFAMEPEEEFPILPILLGALLLAATMALVVIRISGK